VAAAAAPWQQQQQAAASSKQQPQQHFFMAWRNQSHAALDPSAFAHVLTMSKSKWSKERDGVLATLFSKLILLETGIRSARNQSIALDFCFSVTKNHTYLSCDEPAIRSHFRGIVAKLEVQGQDCKADCLSCALDDLLLHPVAADRAAGSNACRYGQVTSQALAVLRGLEGNVSDLEWKGSVLRQQQHEDGALLQQVQQDFADLDDCSSECSQHSSSDLSSWGEDPDQLPPSSAVHEAAVDAPASEPAAVTTSAAFFHFDVRSHLQRPAAAPLQQYPLGQHWQRLQPPAAAPNAAAPVGVARACLAQRCASGAYCSTVIVEESTVVCETLLMLAGLPSRIFSTSEHAVEVCADIAVASASPSACSSWLAWWAQVGSMCTRCHAVISAEYEVESPVIQVRACVVSHRLSLVLNL